MLETDVKKKVATTINIILKLTSFRFYTNWLFNGVALHALLRLGKGKWKRFGWDELKRIWKSNQSQSFQYGDSFMGTRCNQHPVRFRIKTCLRNAPLCHSSSSRFLICFLIAQEGSIMKFVYSIFIVYLSTTLKAEEQIEQPPYQVLRVERVGFIPLDTTIFLP